MVDRYDAAISTADYCVGRIFRALEESGEWDNTVIIVTADHGEGLGDHGVNGHGETLYQHQIFVPLLIKYPRQQQAAVVDEPVSLVDVLPTILDAAGIEDSEGLDGRSLMSSSSTPPPALFAAENQRGAQETKREWAVVSGEWKLITTQSGHRELYNIREDPGEDRNLSSESAEQTGRLLGLLDEWLRATPKYAGGTRQLDPAVIERLRGLGYVQ